MFTTHNNNKPTVFVSPVPNPQAEAVDANSMRQAQGVNLSSNSAN